MRAGNLQLDTHGRLKHFLAIEGLSRSLLTQILDNAERFAPSKKSHYCAGKP
jgi:aspartate carbamoyltransferase catalytic subunit